MPGGRLAAEDEGDRAGSPIVLVHSSIVNRRAWDSTAPLLVKAGYRGIRYDIRGFGESTTEDVEFAAHADVLAVLDHFGVERAAIAGRLPDVAQIIAMEAPDRLAALIVGHLAPLPRWA